MDSRIQTNQTADPPDHPTGSGPDPNPRPEPAPQGGKVLELGKIFIRSVRHFWAPLNSWMDALPDTRFQPMITYHKRFLTWWGLMLFSLKLGSRRNLDFQLRDLELCVLDNLNRLAQTEQESLPVHKTLDHFLGHVGSRALADLRNQCLRHLIRNKVLDRFRFDGEFVLAADGTGFLSFKERHCEHCLKHRNQSAIYYLHPVLEVKLVHPCGLALSMASEFIENPLPENKSSDPATLTEYETVKQDCELKAFLRMAPELKRAFPQTPFCLATDSLMACGPVLAVCEQYHWSFVLTFKPGRTPALWEDFQGVLKLCPKDRLVLTLPDKTRQLFRWVNELSYIDSQGRPHTLNALLCEETPPGSPAQTYAWITNKPLSLRNAAAVAAQGGRVRFKIENQGFNIQKNSGLNLEHAYSQGTDTMKCFYYLLQIAHLFLQMLEMGSLLRQLARQYGSETPVGLFGSLKNIAQRLLDCFRYFRLDPEVFESNQRFQIRLNDTS